MFASVSRVILEDFLILFDKVVAFFQTSDIESEVVARGLINAQHLERRGRAALLIEAMNLKAFRLSIVRENLAKSFGIAVEIGNDGFCFSENVVEFILGELTVGCADGVIRQSGDIDETEAFFRKIFTKNVEGIDSFAGNYVATADEDIIWVFVRSEFENAGAAIYELGIGLVRVDPARLLDLIECCKIDNIFRIQHIDEGSLGGNVINREKTVSVGARII